MKILQVFDFVSLAHGGGTVDILRRLSPALIKRGHKVTIYSSDFELKQADLDSLPGVTVYPFHLWLNLMGLHLTPGIIAEARKRLRDFDVIHLHCVRSFPNIVIHHYARKYGVPYVLDAHGSLPRRHGERGFKWVLKWLFDIAFGYRLLRDASKVIAETETGIREYQEFGIDREKIALITPPFATENFLQLPSPGLFRRKFNLEDKHIIMFLGRIHWIKGLDFLVESFAQLAQRRDDVILVIVGQDDGYQATLERLIRKLALSNKVLFTGFLGGEDKLSALVDADVLVQTSTYEQGTGVPFEAVLCNTPIIVSSNSGTGENVKSIDAGYLVEYGNKGELAKTIQYILDNPAEAQSKTQKAKEYIKANLSMTKGVEKYELLYKESTASRKQIT